jgi:hypothetical protein
VWWCRGRGFCEVDLGIFIAFELHLGRRIVVGGCSWKTYSASCGAPVNVSLLHIVWRWEVLILFGDDLVLDGEFLLVGSNASLKF